jgi:hypothetical protein
MFNSVVAYFEGGSSENSIATPFVIGFNFVKLGITSILIGVALGIISTFVFK